MLVAEKDPRSNLWRIVRKEEAGVLPQELHGFYTSSTEANRAIAQYTAFSEEVKEVKEAKAVDKELWKKAKAMKGMPTKHAYEMLKAQQELETSEDTAP